MHRTGTVLAFMASRFHRRGLKARRTPFWLGPPVFSKPDDNTGTLRGEFEKKTVDTFIGIEYSNPVKIQDVRI